MIDKLTAAGQRVWLFVRRLHRAWRFYRKLDYTWHLAWHKAGWQV